jgi:preprotein translocase subunit YajC
VILGIFLPAILLFQQANPMAQYLSLLPMVAIFAIFYFLLFMPMQKQKKQTQEMLANLKSGDMVITSGGIVGTILSMDAQSDTVVIRVKPDNVKLQVARTAVSSRVDPSPNPA